MVSALRTGPAAFTLPPLLRKYSWYSFMLEADLNPGS